MKTIEIERAQELLKEYINYCNTLDKLKNYKAGSGEYTGQLQVFSNHGATVTQLNSEVLSYTVQLLIVKLTEIKLELKQQIEKL